MKTLPLLQGEVAFNDRSTNRRLAWSRAFALLAALFLLGSVSVQARVIYVNGALQTDPVPTGQTWATAWNTIGDAMNGAADGDEIWVAQGTYKEFVVITNAVALYGGFVGTETNREERDFISNTTTIYGDGGGTNMTRNVVSILAVTNDLARLDGFTVDMGSNVSGSAICTTNASPVIANNRFYGLTNNTRYVIQCQGGGPLITNNHIANNRSIGIYTYGSDARIIRNQIVGNIALRGSLISVSYGAPLVAYNDIVGNISVQYCGGIECWRATVNISNNRIVGNLMDNMDGLPAGVGIKADSCTNMTIANNLIAGNIHRSAVLCLSGDTAGIFCDTNASGKVINNTLIYNQGGRAGGLWCASAQVVIQNNIFAFNSSGVGGVTNMSFANNCVYGNGTTNYVEIPDLTGINSNISIDPMLDGDTESPGWHLLAGSPCIGAGNSSLVSSGWLDVDGEPRLQGSLVDIGVDAFQQGYTRPPPVIYHVSQTGDDRNDGLSWATAIRKVQTAMDRSVLIHKEVWVAAGLHPGCIVMSPFAAMYGGFSGGETNKDQRDWNRNASILDGQGLGSVVQLNFLPGWSHVDGFTIQNGYASLGGGISARYCSPIIANNTIQNNSTPTGLYGSYKGGGVYSERCNLMLTNNLIQSNAAVAGGGVGMYFDRGDIVVRNTFKSNRAPQLDYDTIEGTGGAGLWAVESLATILDNLFMFNTCSNQTGRLNGSARGGAIYFRQIYANSIGISVICNNTIIGNRTSGCIESGGIALLSRINTLFVNNLIAHNSSGIYVQFGTNVQCLNNCISSNIVFNYSGIDDQTGTNGNIAADPALAVPPKPYLLSSSPCIDAGITFPEIVADLDWAGNPRRVGNAVDIGAVEYSSQLPQLSRPIYFVNPNGSDTNGGLSWLDAKRTVQAGIDAASADGGEVWVAAGTYVENLNMRMFVSIYGGFKGDETNRNSRDWNINPTILDGDGKANVIQALSIGDKTAISGFTIQNSGKILTGGGISCSSSAPMISENQIILNRGYSGIYCNNAAPVIFNNLIAFNTNMFSYASFGSGGISLFDSPDAKVINNTIVSNHMSDVFNKATVYTLRGGVFINNTIAFNNSGGIKYDHYGALPLLSNNCVYGNMKSNYSGIDDQSGTNGNISVDPLFIEGTSQLSANSPCIDSGDDSVVTPDMLDLAGTARLQGMHVDIGANEYASAGDWAAFVPEAGAVHSTPVTVGGVTYVPWRFEFADSKYRMVEPGTVSTGGTNFIGRFNLEQWSGSETPGTNIIAGTFVLGALSPGDYALIVNVSGNDVKTVPFSVSGEKGSTLTWQPRSEGVLKLQVLGVADVTYRLLCATNLVNWEILSTHHGAPFELEVTNNTDIPTLFYRVEIVK